MYNENNVLPSIFYYINEYGYKMCLAITNKFSIQIRNPYIVLCNYVYVNLSFHN